MEQNRTAGNREEELDKWLGIQRDYYVAEPDFQLDDAAQENVEFYCGDRMWGYIVWEHSQGHNQNLPVPDVSVQQLYDELSSKGYSILMSDDGLLVTKICGYFFFAFIGEIDGCGNHLVIEPPNQYQTYGLCKKAYRRADQLICLGASEMVSVMEEFASIRILIHERWADFVMEVERYRKANCLLTTYYESRLEDVDLEGIEYVFKPGVDRIGFNFREGCQKRTFYRVTLTTDTVDEIFSQIRDFLTDRRLRRKFGVRKVRGNRLW